MLGRSDRSRWHELARGSVIDRITRELRTIDVVIVAAAVPP